MAKRKFGLISLPFLLIAAGFVFFGLFGTGWAKSDPTADGAVTHIGLKKRLVTYKGSQSDTHGTTFGDFVKSVSGKTVKVKVVMRMFVPYKPLRRLIAGISAAIAALACFATLLAWGLLAGNWLKDYPTFHFDYNFYMTGVAGAVTLIVAIVLCIAQPG